MKLLPPVYFEVNGLKLVALGSWTKVSMPLSLRVSSYIPHAHPALLLRIIISFLFCFCSARACHMCALLGSPYYPLLVLSSAAEDFFIKNSRLIIVFPLFRSA